MQDRKQVKKMIEDNLKLIGLEKVNHIKFDSSKSDVEIMQREQLKKNCNLLKLQCEMIISDINLNVDNERLTKDCIDLLFIIENVI